MGIAGVSSALMGIAVVSSALASSVLFGCAGRSATSPLEADATPLPSRSDEHPPERSASTDPSPSDTTPSQELPAFVDLEVPGFRPARVALPADLRRPRPGWVAAHGAGDGPSWQCAFWRELLEARAFVLCPAGVPLGKTPDDGYFFRNHHELEREVLAAVEALRAAYPDALDPGPLVYAGYSQGATMGSLMLAAHGVSFDRLVLVEGGYGEWTVGSARRFAASGGQRVLFACGITTCKKKAELSAQALERAGISTRVVHAPGGGHTYGGSVGREVRGALGWILEEDPRWR